MNPLRRYRRWKLERRLARLLDEANLPEGMEVVFSGSVQVESVEYE